MALGTAFESMRLRQVAVTADPRGTGSGWSASVPGIVGPPRSCWPQTLGELKKMAGDCDVILIDCPPAVDWVIPQAAWLVSDLATATSTPP